MSHNKTIPTVKGELLLGNLRQMKANAFQAFCDWQRSYGDLVSFRLVTRHFYLVSHPKLIEQALVKQSDVFVKMYDPKKPTGLGLVLGQGLLTSRDELWQRQRRLMQPVFQRSNLVALLPQIVSAGDHLLDRWRGLGNDAEVNLADEMLRVTLEVITQTMFSTSVLDKVDRLAPALDTLLRFSAKTAMNPLRLPLFVPTQANRQFKAAKALLDGIIYEIIEQRRNQAEPHTDLLEMLLNASDDSGNKMSDRQIRDEVITIFTAGHETTANVLTWTLYLLARHPDVLSRLRRELEQLPHDRMPTSEDLQQLVYTRAVLNESMRLYPPAGILMRKIARDTEIDGYSLKQGRLAIFSIYNLHHHPDFWQQPEQFDPERFLNNDSRRFVFMPFGTGERVCIGNHFALLESQVLLGMMLRHFDVQLLSNEETEAEMAVTIKPKGGLPVRLVARG
ncbi:cytochrome P450 [Candidatus Methylobacter oryzae]|uniref:Cytochrome P450 n=1 Tax=Candidatus Methylobacter oryzae TaxID=2497749 RepID=A0ABY3CBN6_9GAMM|nr:cytochrome P450 [Candidatus Methylobacter oryzae]TRW92830.1 cytochrome P450 [Candidatus Methylobacter oryzae]